MTDIAYLHGDRTQYVYVIQDDITKFYYIGSQYGIGVHPSHFWVTYFTSSPTIHKIIKQSGADRFKLIKLVVHVDAYKLETRFLQRYNIAHNKGWLNSHNNILFALGTDEFESAMMKLYGVKHCMSIPEVAKRVGEKGRKTRTAVREDGTTIAQENGKKISKMRLVIQESGLTLAKEAGIKCSITKRIVREDGTSIAQEASLKTALTMTTTILENGLSITKNVALKNKAIWESDEWRKQKYLTCIHCNKWLSPGMFTRWHGDKCKIKGQINDE
jgi:hypothetical protein